MVKRGTLLAILIIIFYCTIISVFAYVVNIMFSPTCGDITKCLQSDTCEEKYCGRTACEGHICVPIIKNTRSHDGVQYYQGRVYPSNSTVSLDVMFILLGIIYVMFLPFIVSIEYIYKKLDSDDNDTFDESMHLISP